MAAKMHEGEIGIDADLVYGLVAAQFPELASFPLTEVDASGTVNAIYRLGTDMYVRLPLVPHFAPGLEKEIEWLPRLAPQLPLAVPEPVAKGQPGPGYPLPWAIYRWIEGHPFERDRVVDERTAAADLAGFVAAMRLVDRSGAPRAGRDLPLRDDDAARAGIRALPGRLDADAATALWEAALRVPPYAGDPVWMHGDLLPPNLLVADGRLRAVIDFGSAGVGDPAVDVIPAWSVFGADARARYRAALDVDDATWARAGGFALRQALLIIPYYVDTNPAFVAMATRTVEELLTDHGAPARA